jgi:hypothetical protein
MAGVDLYAATTERHRVVFVANGLSNATHTLTIRVQSTADPAATGAEVDVDGFVRLR